MHYAIHHTTVYTVHMYRVCNSTLLYTWAVTPLWDHGVRRSQLPNVRSSRHILRIPCGKTEYMYCAMFCILDMFTLL